MGNSEDKQREFELREAELQAKERELKLREMEAEIYQEQKSQEVDIDPPLYRTQKHDPEANSMQKIGRKIVKFAKFAGFMVAGVAIIKAGFWVGMWVTYLLMAGIIATVGYYIFLKDD